MAFGVIYLITNLLNGMKYVGQTTQPLRRRINEHKYGDQYIDRAIKKYGLENFKVEVLEECETKQQLNEREIFWIAKLNCKAPNGYNRTSGGEGHSSEDNPFFGKHHTKKTKAIISKKNRGKKHSVETRARISAATSGENNPNFGKHHTKETRAKIGAKSAGRKHTKESRNKISLKFKGVPKSPDHCAKIAAALTGKKRPAEVGLKSSVTRRKKSPFKNLSNAITEQQLTYTALAKILGLSQPTISEKMRGKINFTAKDIAKLVELFGKPAEYLMQRDD